ncbi:MAG TPA: hypothetical protein VL651_03125 [Bacteroidia bacterium]|jgi:hypothetical protein|nr:hypothetical protein [Bacteroidia bacterium]
MKNSARNLSLVFAFVSLFTATSAFATLPPCFAITAGAGGESVQNSRWELSAGFSASAVWKKNLIGIRGIASQEFVIMRTALGTRECALYFGKYFLSNNTTAYAALGAGISYLQYDVYGERYFPPNSMGEYHYLSQEHTGGLALDAQAGTNMGRFFSIGIHAFASIHTVKTTAGAMLSIRIGILDTKERCALREVPGK